MPEDNDRTDGDTIVAIHRVGEWVGTSQPGDSCCGT
jgi:hypothetical protein